MSIDSSISLQQAHGTFWDAAVVGAGLAGSVIARQLARQGCQVLLVERKQFPRPKVCGACLSQHSLDVLEHVGLGSIPLELGGIPYDHFRLWSRGKMASLKLPTGVAVSRDALDARLVEEAVASGVQFLSGTTAALGSVESDWRELRLVQRDQQTNVRARVVIAADGLTGQLLTQVPEADYRTWEHSRIGAGVAIANEGSDYKQSAIYMGVGRHGYVGLVQVENGGLNLATALDTQWVRQCGTIGRAVESVLADSGLPSVGNLSEAPWRGTPPMTRHARQIAFPRLFAIGDAAGYAEPFTGEGMAWAMTTAVVVVPFVLEAINAWQPRIAQRWSACYHHIVRSRRNLCYRLSTLLRFPQLVHSAVLVLSLCPWLASPFIRRLSYVPKEVYR